MTAPATLPRSLTARPFSRAQVRTSALLGRPPAPGTERRFDLPEPARSASSSGSVESRVIFTGVAFQHIHGRVYPNRRDAQRYKESGFCPTTPEGIRTVTRRSRGSTTRSLCQREIELHRYDTTALLRRASRFVVARRLVVRMRSQSDAPSSDPSQMPMMMSPVSRPVNRSSGSGGTR